MFSRVGNDWILPKKCCYNSKSTKTKSWKFVGFKEHLDWLKRDLNGVEIITGQDSKHTKNLCKWKYTYAALKLRVKLVKCQSNIQWQHKTTTTEWKSARDLKNVCIIIIKILIFAGKFSIQPWVQDRALLRLQSIYENTLEKLSYLSPKSYCNFT